MIFLDQQNNKQPNIGKKKKKTKEEKDKEKRKLAYCGRYIFA